MSVETSTRRVRQARPLLEDLEDRQLLTQPTIGPLGGVHNLVIHDKDLSRWQRNHTNYISASDRRIEYTTGTGARVTLTLYGAGQIRWTDADGTVHGTSYDPAADALDVRFRGTNENSGLVATVHGGNGQARLRSLLPAGLPADSLSGVGASLIRVVNLKDFNLIPGGRVNLTGGVQTFMLNSTAPNTQVALREIPADLLSSGTSSTAQNGVTLGFAIDVFGARTLTSTAGEFIPGGNLFPTALPTAPNKPVAPPGVVASIKYVRGPSHQGGIGNPVTFAYDPTTDTLQRFTIEYKALDPAKPKLKSFVGTPTVFQSNVLGTTGVEAGTALGRYHGQLVVLVSDGATLHGFNALDGQPIGINGTASLAGVGVPNPTRLGNVDSFTVVGNPTTGTGGLGQVQAIDVTESFDTGTVVPVGPAFTSTRDFGLSGGMTGVPGLSTLFTAGGAYFDSFQPGQAQLGLASLSPSTLGFREAARNALTVAGARVNTDPHGATAASPNDALASINLKLGLITGQETITLTDGTTLAANNVTLFSPSTFARVGSVELLYGNRLSGLSSVFYPNIAGTALVDVEGNMQSFRSNDATGLVLNDTGNLNLVKINRAVDTTILGAPFGHAEIPNRQNVQIISTKRDVGTRGGVTIAPSGVLPVGPLTLP